MGALPKHFSRWSLRDRAISVHVGKLVRCNWKLAQEAFMEALHVSTTHPQSLLGTAGEQSRYDVFGNFSRAITPVILPSAIVNWDPTEQEMLDAMLERTLDEPAALVVAEGQTGRDAFCAAQRARLTALMGDKAQQYCDTELVDLFYYTLFPNFHPWGSFNEIVYRFRPWGDDHRAALMEVILLSPFKQGERPPPATMQLLGFDDPVADVPNFSGLGRIFDQDLFNLPNVQKGLEATAKKTVTLAAYQEMKIRHFYELHERWVS
jgi:phenylpropionate dioxygenase-like ring-hydroxylating dioxygenase large terminal subunit